MRFSRGTLSAAALVAALAAFASAVWGHAHRPIEALGTLPDCQKYSGVPGDVRRDGHTGMVRIEGGAYVPGSTHGYAEERPSGAVRVNAFWIDRTEVTNAQFTAFVSATGYLTEAEKRGGGFVFHVPSEREVDRGPGVWWKYVSGATWRAPDGPPTNAIPQHPVVQVTLGDAVAYASWLGRRLPTESEWELAARGGRDDASLHREPKDSRDRPTANFWQGDFPLVDRLEDGFASRAPVGCFAPNPFGLFDVVGNVWEWTSDEYHGARPAHGAKPPVGRRAQATVERVIKGGSYLCSSNFCARYRTTARHPQEEHLSTVHVGFRTVTSY